MLVLVSLFPLLLYLPQFLLEHLQVAFLLFLALLLAETTGCILATVAGQHLDVIDRFLMVGFEPRVRFVQLATIFRVFLARSGIVGSGFHPYFGYL
uniref:Uncharacterized protein n=1 Tax=Anopheles darlingi TaxID=43151 RepID=A0A2M4DED4_ANODA